MFFPIDAVLLKHSFCLLNSQSIKEIFNYWDNSDHRRRLKFQIYSFVKFKIKNVEFLKISNQKQFQVFEYFEDMRCHNFLSAFLIFYFSWLWCRRNLKYSIVELF